MSHGDTSTYPLRVMYHTDLCVIMVLARSARTMLTREKYPCAVGKDHGDALTYPYHVRSITL